MMSVVHNAATPLSFDIGGGNAQTTLRKFARQAKVSVVMDRRDVQGVQTKEVSGLLLPRDALMRMLEGTLLVFNEDLETGAFAITRSDESVSINSLQSSEDNTSILEQETIQKSEMNPKKNRLIKTLASVLTLGVVGSTAQLAAQDDDDEEEEVFELSPFTVDASDNVGYVATSTLAGTRIKTNLSDIGSAISVITSEVFKDTGATDAESILPYSLNVEVAGVQGNFADVSSNGGQRVRSNSTARSGQSATRVRGLSPAILARGLFQTDIPFDSYNTSRITINRGPNSLLFGATTPGGVIDQSLNKATLGDDFGSFEFRIGERGSKRFVFDVNKVLVEDRLALRLSLLDDEAKYQQRPTFKEDQRVYADLNAVLFKGSEGILGRTTLRANVEYGEVDSNPPKITPPGDALTGWFEAPSRDIEQFTGVPLLDSWVDGFVKQHTVNPFDASVDELSEPILISRPFFINMALYYAQPDLQVASQGIPGLENVAGMPARTLYRNLVNDVNGDPLFRQDTWATFPILGNAQFAPGFTVPTINDRNVFDNQNIAVAGTIGYRNSDFDVQSVALEQSLFGGKGGIELAFDQQSFDNEFHDPFGGGSAGFGGNSFRGNEIRVDITELLPNGDPNPNLGRPFMVDFSTPHFTESTERDSKRLTAFYELDFTDRDGFIGGLGRHVFTGFYSEDSAEISGTQSRNKWVDVPGSPFSVAEILNHRLDGERRNVPLIVYLGDDLRGLDSVSDVRLTQFASFPTPQSGDRAINQFHPSFPGNPVTPLATSGPGLGGVVPLYEDTFEVYRSLFDGSTRRTENRAKSLGWQSYFFGGNLVGLMGWRDDSVKTIENISLANFIADTPSANSDGLLDDGEFDARRIRLADESNPAHAGEVVRVGDGTFTWSLVAHLPERFELPGGANLSVHYNESESFVPTRTRRDFNGNDISPESGSTKEYGFTLSTRNKRLSAKVNWFELEQSSASVLSGAPNAPGGITAWLRFWKQAENDGFDFEDSLLTGLTERPANISPDLDTYDEFYDAIIGLMPQQQQDLYNIRFDPDTDVVLVDENPGQTVTTNAVAEGVEIDIIGNITESWSIILNYGKQETTTSNSAPVAGDFVQAVAANLVSTGLADITFVPSLGEYSPMGVNWTANVNALNGLRGRDGTVSLEQRNERINLLSTYSFLGDSRLKGLTVGGALRWQSEIATGYPVEIDSFGGVTPIVSRPFLGPTELNGDVWVSYEREINPFGDRPIDWKIQLNVRNAIGDDDYIPVVTNPDGNLAVVRNPPTREFFLTNTFSF